MKKRLRVRKNGLPFSFAKLEQRLALSANLGFGPSWAEYVEASGVGATMEVSRELFQGNAMMESDWLSPDWQTNPDHGFIEGFGGVEDVDFAFEELWHVEQEPMFDDVFATREPWGEQGFGAFDPSIPSDPYSDWYPADSDVSDFESTIESGFDPLYEIWFTETTVMEIAYAPIITVAPPMEVVIELVPIEITSSSQTQFVTSQASRPSSPAIQSDPFEVTSPEFKTASFRFGEALPPMEVESSVVTQEIAPTVPQKEAELNSPLTVVAPQAQAIADSEPVTESNELVAGELVEETDPNRDVVEPWGEVEAGAHGSSKLMTPRVRQLGTEMWLRISEQTPSEATLNSGDRAFYLVERQLLGELRKTNLSVYADLDLGTEPLSVELLESATVDSLTATPLAPIVGLDSFDIFEAVSVATTGELVETSSLDRSTWMGALALGGVAGWFFMRTQVTSRESDSKRRLTPMPKTNRERLAYEPTVRATVRWAN